MKRFRDWHTHVLAHGEAEQHGEDGVVEHGEEALVQAEAVVDGPRLGHADFPQELF